jgi:hypothetical protein
MVLLVLVCAVIISQCSKETDEDAIMDLIAMDTIWFNSNTEVDSTSNSLLLQDTMVVWWRGAQTHSEPIIEIQVLEDSAWVSWSRDNYGHLYSLAKIDTFPWVLWDKVLDETAELRATFLRTGDESAEHRGWELHTISLAYGESNTVNTVRIDSVLINSTNYQDLVITDPLDTFFDLDSLITFPAGQPVTLTVYTNVEDGHAFLHTFILAWPYYVRLPFTNMGDGVYEGTWNAQLVAVPRFAIFDLMPHSTLYMETGPYDFNGWLLPYMISN